MSEESAERGVRGARLPSHLDFFQGRQVDVEGARFTLAEVAELDHKLVVLDGGSLARDGFFGGTWLIS